MAKKFFSKKKIIIFIISALIVAGAVFYFSYNGPSKTSYVTDVVQRKDLVQTVSEVGTVESPSQIDLNFALPGTLAAKFAGVGDTVKTGEVLAQLDITSLTISRNQAAANLASAQASLSKLWEGATPAQLAVAQAQVDQANAAYASAANNLNKVNSTVAENISQAQSNLNDLQGLTANVTTFQQTVISSRESMLNDISSKSSQAITALDSINSIVTDDSIKDYLSSKDKTYLTAAKSDYASAQTLLTAANSSLAAAENNKSTVNVEQAASDSLSCLKKIADSLNELFNALANSSISNQTVLNTDKTNISAQITATNGAVNMVSADQQGFAGAQAAWDSAVTSAKNILASAQVSGNQQISAAQSNVDAAKQGLDVAQKQLAQLKAPARAADVALAQAQVNGAQASLDQVNNQINNDMIKSPIDGQVVKDNYTVGEQTNLQTPIFSVLAQNDLEISVDISESDIAKLKENDPVQITLDAFGPDKKFNGLAYFIDPAATVIQDVTYYRVKIRFTDSTSTIAQIKPGMTANVTITADRRTAVLTVPERAVIAQTDGSKIVRILDKGKVSEVPVQVGLRGDDGSIEITQGNLLSGQTVVVFINTK